MRQKRIDVTNIFLEECNDGLVKVFENKIEEFRDNIKRLSRKDLKKRKGWDWIILPEIDRYQKEIRKFKWHIKRIITYNQEKLNRKRIDVDDLLARIDIVNFIGDYVELNRYGHEYRGLCPLHDEKTPSFFVNREKRVWHCFGCEESGNVISFLMKINNYDFKNAIYYLKKMYG